MASAPQTDFVDLWKRSEPPTQTNEPSALTKTSIAERLSGSRSVLWTNLSQMSPSDQTVVMTKLTGMWPYERERRALNWPMQAGMLTNCVTSALIATRINSDMVMFEPKMSFLESVRRCPKSPFVFGVYSSGITYYVLQQSFIMPHVFRETDPCPSCLLTRSIAIGLFTGIFMPMIATPYLCYYVLLQRKNEKFPAVKNLLEFVMLSIQGSKASRSLLMRLIPLQVAVISVATYAMLWGRQRIFSTMDADPEFAKDLLLASQSKPTVKERIMSYLRKIPLISDVMINQAPEEEKTS